MPGMKGLMYLMLGKTTTHYSSLGEEDLLIQGRWRYGTQTFAQVIWPVTQHVEYITTFTFPHAVKALALNSLEREHIYTNEMNYPLAFGGNQKWHVVKSSLQWKCWEARTSMKLAGKTAPGDVGYSEHLSFYPLEMWRGKAFWSENTKYCVTKVSWYLY